jgi:hypothetical protein
LIGPDDYFVNFNGHGKYSAPEMTFDPVIVPTSIVFFPLIIWVMSMKTVFSWQVLVQVYYILT